VPPFANRDRGQVALGKKIAAQAVTDLAGVNAVVLFLCGGDGARHQRVRRLQSTCMRLEVTMNPAREHGRFHFRAPRLWQRLHPVVQVHACGGKRSFGIATKYGGHEEDVDLRVAAWNGFRRIRYNQLARLEYQNLQNELALTL
jgi:hypothetical protein